MIKSKTIKTSILILLIFILSCSFTIASSIDYSGTVPIIKSSDSYITDYIIAVDSSKYKFDNVKVKDVYETQCKKYDFDLNGTSHCSKTKKVLIKTKYKVATLTLSNCIEGKNYQIYKNNAYLKNKKQIIETGFKYAVVKCKDNKLMFDVESFSSYTQAQVDLLLEGIETYYSFDDVNLSGSNPLDSSPNGNDGTSTSIVTGVTGIINEGFDFVASNNANVDTNYKPSIGDVSFSMWLNPDDFTNDYGIFTTCPSGSRTNCFNLVLSNSPDAGELSFQTYDNSASNTLNLYSISPLTVSTWNHLVITLDGTSGDVETFIDGVSVSTGASTGLPVSTHNTNLVLGNINGGVIPYNGIMDEFIQYDKILTEAEIDDIYNSGSGFNPYTYELPNIVPTAINHIPLNVIDEVGVKIKGDEFILLSNFTFNLTRNQDAIIKGFGYSDSSRNSDNTLFIKINNDDIIFNDSVSIISSDKAYRQWNIKPIIYNGVIGSNNIEVWAREEGYGEINIYNFDLYLESEETTNGYLDNQIQTKTNDTTATTSEFISNFQTTKTNTSSVWFESSLKYSNNDATPTTVECVFIDRSLGTENKSPKMMRYLGANKIGSLGMAYFLDTSATNVTVDLYCNNSNGNNVTVQSSIYSFIDDDNQNETVGGYVNTISNTGEFTEGTHLLSKGTYSRLAGEGVMSQFSSIFESRSGTQEDNNAPIFKINTSKGCYKEYKRSLDEESRFGAVSGGIPCKSDFNESIDYIVYVTVATGETLYIDSCVLAGFTVQDINISKFPVPIINEIISPLGSTTQTDSFTLTQSVLDLDGRGWASTISLMNDDFVEIKEIVAETSKLNKTSYYINMDGFNDAEYYLTWTVDDGNFTDSSTIGFTFSTVAEGSTSNVASLDVGVCPVNTSSTMVLILIVCVCLFFIALGFTQRTGILGMIGSIGLLVTSWFIVGCVPAMGMIFFSLGTVSFIASVFIKS